MNACRLAFPQPVVNGCLFHFSQAIWRNVVNRARRAQYLDIENPEVRNQIQKIMGLPFIPLNDLLFVWDLLNEKFVDDILDLASYIEITFITGHPAREQGRAVPPRFSPEIWNVYEFVINGRQLTNNVVEGFHSQFQRLVVAHHVNIWRFISHLERQQAETEHLVTQFSLSDMLGKWTNLFVDIFKCRIFSRRGLADSGPFQNLLDEHMTVVEMEYVDQSHDLASDVKFEENLEPFSFSVVKDEPETSLCTAGTEFLGSVCDCIKEEYEDHSHDLTSEIKFEEDPVPISFPVVKREPEEEQSDLATVNEEPRVEGTAEDNEIFTEWIAANKERCVSSKFDGIAQEENETVCEIPKNSDSSEKRIRTREDKKQLQLEMSKEYLSNLAKSTTHLRERVVKNAYKCDICGRSFSTSCNVKKHELLHAGEKLLRCDVCGKCYSQSRYLRKHEDRHTGDKTFKCDICGKWFWELSALGRHERVHTRDKPFKCDKCSLKSHELQHTGEKPFKCDVCGKFFSQLSILKCNACTDVRNLSNAMFLVYQRPSCGSSAPTLINHGRNKLDILRRTTVSNNTSTKTLRTGESHQVEAMTVRFGNAGIYCISATLLGVE
ncbi:hypothetical protein ANN_28000 [Periplaneta americana]|uniref:C2H2-type domain-containing protein n=1 Tax=Periplaneta americana TaxID=6978 RepID=A0ABQ8RV11_PERAM|nr:hypothetical protein ANN_28000 [Periplaneta americana]